MQCSLSLLFCHLSRSLMTEPLFSVSFAGLCAFRIQSRSLFPCHVLCLFFFPLCYLNRDIDRWCSKLHSNIFMFFLLPLITYSIFSISFHYYLLSVSHALTNIFDPQKMLPYSLYPFFYTLCWFVTSLLLMCSYWWLVCFFSNTVIITLQFYFGHLLRLFISAKVCPFLFKTLTKVSLFFFSIQWLWALKNTFLSRLLLSHLIVLNIQAFKICFSGLRPYTFNFYHANHIDIFSATSNRSGFKHVENHQLRLGVCLWESFESILKFAAFKWSSYLLSKVVSCKC